MPHLLIAGALFYALLSGPVGAAPRSVVDAIIRVESGGNPKATGRAGEIGLMQIRLQTARSMGYRGSRAALYHPETNIKYGTAYLDAALKRTGGNLCHALTLYNRGLAARPTRSKYCEKVLAAMRR